MYIDDLPTPIRENPRWKSDLELGPRLRLEIFSDKNDKKVLALV
jgi:hypothetical protein